MSLPEPPSADDLDELEAFFMSDAVDEEGFGVSMLDGYLTAVVIGPDLILPSEWMPPVWGRREPEFVDEEQSGRIIGLVMSVYNGVVDQFADDMSEEFEPLYYNQEVRGRVVDVPGPWCGGFVFGSELHPTWNTPAARRKTGELMVPMVALGTSVGFDALTRRRNRKAVEAELAADVIPSVRALHAYWLAHRRRTDGTAELPTVPARPAAGRNDPCPCGSGAKFKKCCGDPARIVH